MIPVNSVTAATPSHSDPEWRRLALEEWNNTGNSAVTAPHHSDTEWHNQEFEERNRRGDLVAATPSHSDPEWQRLVLEVVGQWEQPR